MPRPPGSQRPPGRRSRTAPVPWPLGGLMPASVPVTTVMPCSRIRPAAVTRLAVNDVKSRPRRSNVDRRPGGILLRRRHESGVGAHGRAHLDPGRGDVREQVVGQQQAVGGEPGEVLDPVDPGVERVPDAGERVGVGQDLQTGCMGRLARPARRTLALELGAERVGARREHAAARHHLDHVDAALRVLRHGATYAVRPGRLAAEVVAVPVRHRDRWSRGDDPGETGQRRGPRASGSAGRPGRAPSSPRPLPAPPGWTGSPSRARRRRILPARSSPPIVESATRWTWQLNRPGQAASRDTS